MKKMEGEGAEEEEEEEEEEGEVAATRGSKERGLNSPLKRL